MKAEFTILRDHDGYWLIEKSQAEAVIANPEQYRTGAIKTATKIASCRVALSRAIAMGATELQIDGVGATTGASQEIRKAGIKPLICIPSAMTDLTSEYWARNRLNHSQAESTDDLAAHKMVMGKSRDGMSGHFNSGRATPTESRATGLLAGLMRRI